MVGLLLGLVCLLLYRGYDLERAQRTAGWQLGHHLCGLWWHVLKTLRKSCGCFLSAIESMGDYMFFSLVDVLPSNTMKLFSEIVTMQIDLSIGSCM